MLSAFGSVHPAFRKDKTIMEKMTREDVDNMILESFGEQYQEELWDKQECIKLAFFQ